MQTVPFRAYKYVLVAALLITASGHSAFSDESTKSDSYSPGIVFELGGGLSMAPSFEGSDRYEIGGYPMVRFERLTFGNGFTLGGGDGQGLSFIPSFRYIGKRSSADDPALTGLNDVGASFEAGASARYTFGNASVFSTLRYGIVGHNGWVGEFGGDLTFKPLTHTTLSAGPRVSVASGKYMQRQFGVTAGEAAAFGSQPFNASAGFKSVGAELALRHDFNDQWAAESGLGYARLVGDAANSPVTAVGSRDQYTLKFGLVRKFRIDF